METTEKPIVLVLTRDEAATLRDVACFISGHTERSRRRHITSILKQLIQLGYSTAEYNRRDISPKANINFEDDK